MSRALSLTCTALLLVGLTSSVVLAAKPSIAVLGLEVIDPNGTPTAADTQVAKELSDGLRARAKAGSGPYQLAPGSDKELIDQKLLNNCDSEAPSCMSTIGNQLGAEILMYGRLEKQGKQYQITLKVLDVSRKAVLKSSSDMIPIAEANGAALQGWAKKMYAKLTGESSASTLIVKLGNADRGTILIDGEPKGTITNGTGQVALSEGKYRVTVESEGFRRWEKEVSLSGSQTLPVELERSSAGGVVIGTEPGLGGGSGPELGPEGGSGKGKWKVGAAVGGAMVVGGLGWWIYNWRELEGVKEDQCNNGIVRDDCTPTGSPIGFDINASNKKGDRHELQTLVGAGILGVGVAVAGFSIWKLTSKSGSSTEQAKRGRRVKKERTFVVTPVVTKSSSGATLRIDW